MIPAIYVWWIVGGSVVGLVLVALVSILWDINSDSEDE